jgi:anti-sigma factor RsiW
VSEFANTTQFKLDHRWAPTHMSAYLDGELTDPRRRRMEDHLARCQRCRRLLASLRETVAAARALPAPVSPTPGSELAAAVIARLSGRP